MLMRMSFFPDKAGPAELIALAWTLEEGSRKFYASIAVTLADNEAAKLFADLESAEEHHKASLLGLYRDIANEEPGPDFPRSIIAADEDPAGHAKTPEPAEDDVLELTELVDEPPPPPTLATLVAPPVPATHVAVATADPATRVMTMPSRAAEVAGSVVASDAAEVVMYW